MKKILTVIVALVMAVPMSAQYYRGGSSIDKSNLYYGARFGLTMANTSGDIDLGTKSGMTLAGVIGMQVSSVTPLFIESGLYYTQRGGKGTHEDQKWDSNLNYLELPFLIKYGIKTNSDFALLPFVGPYFSYAMSGKTKKDGVKHSSFVNNAFHHPDMGFKVGCGVEYNMVYLEAGFQIGVADISDTDESTHGNAFFVNFGVNF
ncbi:MAG: outer membrane beta-barrel protein [Prevotella sp.]|nr:outer membrane beta-barrel protein [Prevotella sp.]